MTDTVISLRDVCKRYARATRRNDGGNMADAAACNLNLNVRRGEILSLLGPSGSDKSTTLRVIAGLESPDTGEVWMEGAKVAGRGAWLPPEKRRVGLVFQDYALFPHLTVGKNIAFPLQKLSRAEKAERVAEMLHLVGLAEHENRYPHQLSGGQQQRVALARALAPRPAVVLLDEPFSSLDADSRVHVREGVRDILKRVGATAVFVTHDQEEALFMGDRVAVMNRGRIEQIGTPQEIFGGPATRFVAEFLGMPSFLPATVTLDGLQTEIGFQPQPLPVPAGTSVEVLVRPDDLSFQVDPRGDGRVVRSQFRGMDYLYDIELPSGRTVRCLGGHTSRILEGTAVRVTLTPGHDLACFRDKDERCDLCSILWTGAHHEECAVVSKG